MKYRKTSTREFGIPELIIINMNTKRYAYNTSSDTTNFHTFYRN